MQHGAGEPVLTAGETGYRISRTPFAYRMSSRVPARGRRPLPG